MDGIIVSNPGTEVSSIYGGHVIGYRGCGYKYVCGHVLGYRGVWLHVRWA